MDLIKTLISYVPYYPPDQRSSKWLLMGSPYPLLSILIGYLYFVLRYGPRYMEKQAAYELKIFIRLYNVFQIIANAAIVYRLLTYNIGNPLHFSALDRTPDGNALKIAETFWWLLLLKMADLVETGVFVLRKKNKQVSILHLYHHVSIVILAWLTAKLYPGGPLAFHAIINSTIHIIMYSYYLASSSGLTDQRIVYSIKKFITGIQMAQFLFLIVHTLQGFLPNHNDMPAWGVSLILVNLIMNFLLFFNFYRKTYIKYKTTKSQ